MQLTRRHKLIIAGVVITPILLFGLYVWGAVVWSYSEGERVGYVQKFSHKGWLCKTWEGELAMVAVPGSMPEKFFFTVRSDSVAAQVNKSSGKRVRLHYEQHLGIPTSCFGDTQFFVTGVEAVE